MDQPRSRSEVVIESKGQSIEDIDTIEKLLTTRLPKGWSFKRDHLPFLGFLWEWDNDGWTIYGSDQKKVASLYSGGRAMVVWGEPNVEILRLFTEALADRLEAQIRVSVA